MRTQFSAADLPKVVKVERTEVHYRNSNGEASIHAAGCQHKSDSPPEPITVATLGEDDWFYVAPCAKRKAS